MRYHIQQLTAWLMMLAVTSVFFGWNNQWRDLLWVVIIVLYLLATYSWPQVVTLAGVGAVLTVAFLHFIPIPLPASYLLSLAILVFGWVSLLALGLQLRIRWSHRSLQDKRQRDE